MDKKFNPQGFEQKHYKNWLDNKYFSAKINKNKTPFTIIMPPPNITSRLHLGHAYDISIMDTIARFKRMQGFETLLLPGCDHAALATEAKVVERLKSQGITKQDLGREEFIKKMYEWYDEFGTIIVEQFKLVGASSDWDRYAFTLDEPRNKAVRTAFVNLYNKGVIYRGNRINHWCPNCLTALSDIEVEYEENAGNMWHIKYPIENSNQFIVVATTRPETMFGDVAVAVNPSDKRHTNLVGKYVVLPLLNKRIPIIADEYVDKEFGTGFVKITPAHDPNDYEIGKRHNLPTISILNLNGTLNQNAGQYNGLDRFVARKQVVADLDKLGLLLKTEPYKNNVGHCQRCHNIIEPMISDQWYVKMQDLADRAVKVVQDKEIKFIPQRFAKIYYNWLNNIQDWCISRQIWSGHRIPVFYCNDCGHLNVEIENPTKCSKCGSTHLTQDSDSLDTWFSSALWPFSTLGWPEKTADYDYFFPTNLMVTGYDIIFFWVARMIFSSLEYTNQIPFSEVYIHGLIRDMQGRKMSKSLGNGVDPIEIINKYGADALRFSLLQNVGVGQDSKFSIEKSESASNFLNKLWNASRFVTENVSKINFVKLNLKDIALTYSDKWILSQLNDTIKNVTKAYNKYDLGMVITYMYEFVWNKFCDWYIEASKVKLNSQSQTDKNEVLNVLVYVLENILKLLHPITPFVTEEIYQNLPNHSNSIMVQPFPVYLPELDFKANAKTFEQVMDLIKGIRNLRAELKVTDNVKTELYLLPNKQHKVLESLVGVITKLANGNSLTIVKSEAEINFKNVFAFNQLGKLYLPTETLVDTEKEKERLSAELNTINAELQRAQGMLANANFVNKAPKHLIDAEQEKILKYTQLKETVLQSLNNL